MLQILAAIERMELDPSPLGPAAGTLARVFEIAMRDVRRHLADPDRMIVHPSTLLEDGHLAGFIDEVRGLRGTVGGPTGGDGDTIALVTADAEGHAVSLVQSLWIGFGSGTLDPATGILAHSRGACFTLDPERAGVFTPGVRPPHTLVPVLIHDRAGLVGVTGTMGGYQQPQVDVQTVIHAFVEDLSPAEAVAAPRWVVDDLPDDDGLRPSVVAETSVPVAAVDAILDTGADLVRVEDLGRSVGHAHLLRVTSGGLEAGSESRADGNALAG